MSSLGDMEREKERERERGGGEEREDVIYEIRSCDVRAGQNVYRMSFQ